WRLRDLNSLNGIRVNGDRLDSEWELAPQDDVHLGHTRLLFVEDMSQLPDLPPEPPSADGMSIKKRLGQTRLPTPQPPENPPDQPTKTPPPSGAKHSLSRDLSLLYRLALDMGSAGSYPDLVRIVLDALLEATPAEVGAILTVQDNDELEVTAH